MKITEDIKITFTGTYKQLEKRDRTKLKYITAFQFPNEISL
jgi:hypothetical protein